jgi:hypothetical protein
MKIETKYEEITTYPVDFFVRAGFFFSLGCIVCFSVVLAALKVLSFVVGLFV